MAFSIFDLLGSEGRSSCTIGKRVGSQDVCCWRLLIQGRLPKLVAEIMEDVCSCNLDKGII